MIIVWLSLALAVIMVIWLVFRVFKEVKAMQETVVDVSKSAEILRKSSESVLKHRERLLDTSGKLMDDVEHKKRDVAFTMNQGKTLVKQFSKSKQRLTSAYKKWNDEKFKI